MPDFHTRETCRLCEGALRKVLELPDTPLANEYPAAPIDGGQDTFPLFLAQCVDCGHVQLPVVVNPERLFRDYAYQSGTSPVFRKHLEDFARDVQPKVGGLVVEIGSNDGTLLAEYKRRSFRVLGVDPARNLVDAANAKGLDTLCAFFDVATAREIVAKHGHADLIVANNVFAHANNLKEIAQGVAELLAPCGRFVFEVGYLPDMIDRGIYRTIYHEHLSFHHLQALQRFFIRIGLVLVDAKRVATQGGSIRCTVKRASQNHASVRLGWFCAEETRGNLDASKLARRIADDKARTRRQLDDLRAVGKTVAGYGAPAQLTTTMYALGLTRQEIDFVVDDNPAKVGRFTPGLFVPIVGVDQLYARNPDACLIFSGNFAANIRERHDKYEGLWIEI